MSILLQLRPFAQIVELKSSLPAADVESSCVRVRTNPMFVSDRDPSISARLNVL